MKNCFIKHTLLGTLSLSIIFTSSFLFIQDVYAQQKGKTTSKHLYRWVDEKGNVLYLDSLPREALGKERKEISINTGQTTNIIPATKSEEDRAALIAVEEQEKIAKEQFEKQKESDMQLLIFPSEEIALERFNQEMIKIEDQIKIIEETEKNRQEKIIELLNVLGDREVLGKEITKEMSQNIINTRNQILNNRKEKQILADRKKTIKEDAVNFITRYRWLKANPENIGLLMDTSNQ